MTSIPEIFGIEIYNQELFTQALIHPSYTKEHELDYTKSYERLEFLGDAVLKLMISNILYKKYPNFSEGEMSKIRSIVVSDATLSKVCKKLELSKLIILPKHEEKQGCRELESVCACVFEAVLGAFYLDGKLSELMEFIERIFYPYIEDAENNFEKFNAKALLQEYTQAQTKEIPVYSIIKESGPAHKKIFEVTVTYQNRIVGVGSGKSKKEAEQNSAYNACIELGVIECQK